MKNEQYPIFVYGTLRNGLGNYNRILQGMTERELVGYTRGNIHEVGGGGFPCLLKNKERVIRGEIMWLKPEVYERVMKRLDALEGFREHDPEGSMYTREMARIMVDDPSKKDMEMTDAWIYYWNSNWRYGDLIESGCWVTHMQEREVKGFRV